MRTHLSGGEGQAHGADGLRVLVRLLLHLQQLRRLYQRLQSLFGAARHQAFVPEPLLQLADVVPATETRLSSISTSSISETSRSPLSLPSDRNRRKNLTRAPPETRPPLHAHLICIPLLQEHMSLRSSRLLRVTAPTM